MPYDPDWDLEEGDGYKADTLQAEADHGSLSSGHASNGMGAVGEGDKQGQETSGHEDGPDNVKSEDGMEVELPDRDRHHFGNAQHDRHTTPRSRLPFPGAEAIARLPHVEVVLHSSPRRSSFTALEDEMMERIDGEMNLVTSDIVPDQRRHQERPPAKAQAVPPKTQTSAVPAPILTPQPKKRGRPVGWRLGYGSYTAMRSGLPPGSSTPRPKPQRPTSEQKARRRPGRKPAPTARETYLKLNPRFISFRCEWENCPAELQNLDTLLKHLLVVHGRPSSSASSSESGQPLPCKWSNCTAMPLPSRDSFAAHVETAHLIPYLWHAGDGPRNSTPTPPTTSTTTAAEPLPSYLFNERGEQVTPSIAGQQVENEEERKKRQARVNRVLLQRDQNAPEEPDYTPRELEMITELMSAKRARQEMFREYARRVYSSAEMAGWKPY
ncbi:hypothetical protein MYCTH_2121442 [Thermothelomyces thermophilus ATCC 42464]|uniref:C2H2-type domain-containing protein n=1 Tax=Thermothelomyces thermophilus (strain ATCC 42464 / BCRC 31852 / DSM 1799) TaxID=573729 RepID=G2QQ04_THET4|nr:uncharacterized protein MYCTH_2121442 [Thermothelomyces thermophilus ATCC 42464]AEO61667.1 hypothetical protein MYCTH_2121442 [Thermothelomyces thermophilus ATCC 42464]